MKKTRDVRMISITYHKELKKKKRLISDLRMHSIKDLVYMEETLHKIVGSLSMYGYNTAAALVQNSLICLHDEKNTHQLNEELMLIEAEILNAYELGYVPLIEETISIAEASES